MQIPDKDVREATCFWTWMGDDGVVRTKVKPGSRVTIEHAWENTRIVNSFEGGKFPILVDTRDLKSITKEARSHFAINNRESKVNAIALVIGSRLTRIIGNFFMGDNRSGVPVKLFTKTEAAVNWCKRFVSMEEPVNRVQNKT